MQKGFKAVNLHGAAGQEQGGPAVTRITSGFGNRIKGKARYL